MDSSYNSLTTLTFLLSFMVLQSFEELVLLHHPTIENGPTRNVTCVSDFDDAALIWNSKKDFEPDETRNNLANFQPKNPASDKDVECAIWDKLRCKIRWAKTGNWSLFKSNTEPMGPAFDYRWEDFKEYVFENSVNKNEFQLVGEVPEGFGSVFFSARGRRSVQVVLCETQNATMSSCFSISLAVKNGNMSNIASCEKGIPKKGKKKQNVGCNTKIKREHNEEDIFHPYEWRTFGLSWNSSDQSIKVFNGTDIEPFLECNFENWYNVKHILVRSNKETRIRFHLYDYWLTTQKNTILSTAAFNQHDQKLCMKLLVSLCSECTLNITLVDAYKNSRFPLKNISRKGETSRYGETVLWESFKIEVLLADITKLVKLEVQTFINEDEERGYWAIDNFRMCESEVESSHASTKIETFHDCTTISEQSKKYLLSHSTRKSTVTIYREKHSYTWPKINCQKLSNNVTENAVIYLPEEINHADTIHHKFHGETEKGKQSPKTNFDKGWIICRSNGCVSDQGHTDIANECVKECLDGFYGHDCKKCGICNDAEPCNKTTGFCDKGCADLELSPPLCKPVPGKVRNLISQNKSEDVIELKWDPPVDKNEILNYTVTIKRDELFGCKNLGKSSPCEDEASYEVTNTSVILRELNPYALYTATVIAKPANPKSPPTVTFRTLEKSIPTAKISHLRFNEEEDRLEWKAPEDCTTISGRHGATKLCIEKVDAPEEKPITVTVNATNFYYDLKQLKLEPYTKYNVRAYILRDAETASENHNVYAKLTWRSPPTAPKPVKGLEAYEVDLNKNTASLRWKHTETSASEIESYIVLFYLGKHTFLNRTYKLSDGELKCKLWTEYVCLKNVNFKPGSSVKVSAKNKHVEEPGSPDNVTFNMDDWFKKPPGKPLNLTAHPQTYGTVILKWRHPSFTPVTIAKFCINVEILSTNLIADPTYLYPITQNYDVTEKQKEYQTTINVATASRYRISVKAVNQRNVESVSARRNVSVKPSLDFESINKLDMKRDENTIRLRIPALINATRNTMLHVTVKRFLTCERKDSKPSLEKHLNSEVILMNDIEVTDNKPKIVNISMSKTVRFVDNCLLLSKEYFKIEVRVNDSFSKETDDLPRFTAIRSLQEKPQKQNLLWLLLVIPLTMTILLLIYFRTRLRPGMQKNQHSTVSLPMSVNFGAPSKITSTPCAVKQSIDPPPPPPNLSPRSVSEQSKPDVVQSDDQSRPVKIEEFEEYAKEALASGLLEFQYTQFPKGFLSTCRYAKLPENKSKNRYSDRVPYDKNRVELEKVSDDPYSDYINASYVQGYRKTRAYIATQGPKPNTVKDFWKMVWQENARVICMVANIIESGKTKCEKYWPECGSNIKYGDIIVSNIGHEVLADYVVRTLQIECQNDKREITHLHYTGWPDHGVPMYTQSLVAYLKKILATPAGKGPVVVHCSAGVGRTGTIILCDICLRQAVVERVIDMPMVVRRMRGDRANMVDNAQQYCLAHLVVLESIFAGQTQMQCSNDLPEQINKMRQQLPLDMQRLKDAVWQDRVLQSMWAAGGFAHENIGNKGSELVPVNPAKSEFEQPPSFARVGNYSNIISVVGVKMKNQYLVSQLPSPSTLRETWKIIGEMNVELVIVLQSAKPQDDTPICDIITSQPICVPLPYLQVITERSFEDKHFTTHQLLLIDTSQEEERLQTVTVITCTGWGCDEGGKPPTVKSLVSLWNSSEKIPRKAGPVLVLCRDGVTACGLYVALSFMLERMAMERECDVISAVRAVRRSNPGFVKSKEQFEYLYDAAVNYFGCFETYANFS
ncbi:uncharacterized protein LOC107223610 isoform X2 [Neodiprion lecontei]|uniref:protein-tyrosine-phosphatase n=1 Tax=Neodiprion lecontei TaxID=441921 RepID=A0ABM3FP98_NEOLC|nr:uncharacterized protein LOC107223610 isoform X2 [Neodiprion lecontei]